MSQVPPDLSPRPTIAWNYREPKPFYNGWLKGRLASVEVETNAQRFQENVLKSFWWLDKLHNKGNRIGLTRTSLLIEAWCGLETDKNA